MPGFSAVSGRYVSSYCQSRVRRTGTPRWWCRVHHAAAWGANGERRERCDRADEPPPAEVFELDLDLYVGGVAMWGALDPVINTTDFASDCGVHLHARLVPDGRKVIDRTFPAVRIRRGEAAVVVGRAEAVAYVAAAVFGLSLKPLQCPRCQAWHLDADWFSVNGHRKHQCNTCGREFFDPDGTLSIGNPLMLVKALIGDVAIQRPTVAITRRLEVSQTDFPGGMQVWGSNPGLLWTAARPEEEGIHVHGYDGAGRRLVDDTFSHVEIDGEVLEPEMVRFAMVQQSLPHLHPHLTSLECSSCGTAHFDRGAAAYRPVRIHRCHTCERELTAPRRRRVVSNPFLALRSRLLGRSRG